MKTILFNYLCVVLVLCVVYQYIPKRKVEIENIYLFVGSGLVIYFLYDRIIARENFEAEVVAPVAPEVVAPVAPEVVAPVAPEVVVSVEPTLSDREILDHVQTIIKNIKNEANLKKIYQTVQEIVDPTVKDLMTKIYNMTVLNPVAIGRVVLTAPQNIIEIANIVNKVPELKNTLNKVKNDANNQGMINDLSSKIDKLEGIIKSLDTNDTIPNFLQQMANQDKYIDRNGMVQDALYGDMKYNQLTPEQMQPRITREDDEWDTTGYTMVDPAKIRPPHEMIRDYYQEDQCPVCPSMTSGYPVNLLDFDKSRYVIGSDNISVDYIKKLNDKNKF